MIFNNFIWGRELQRDSTKFRISRDRLCMPIEMGGFGMMSYDKIIDRIKCRQLCKLFHPGYHHPLKYLTIKEDSHFSIGNNLTRIADELAVGAHNLIWSNFLSSLKNLSNDQIVSDFILTNQLGEINVSIIIKPRLVNTIEVTSLVHHLNCTNIKDIINYGRSLMSICRKVVKSQYLRVIKAIHQSNRRCENVIEEKLRISDGCYRHIYGVKSRDFRNKFSR
jgi:hypothetical protein